MLKQMRQRAGAGLSTIEVLVALVLVVLVVVFTWRVIGSSLALLGSGNQGYQRAARVRTQATEWIQGIHEYTSGRGFSVCGTVPCTFWIPAVSGPYSQAPALPAGFACGRVVISDWDGGGPVDPAQLRLVTIDIFRARTACDDTGVGNPFLTAQTGMATRQ